MLRACAECVTLTLMCLRCDGSAIGNVLNAFLPREMDVILMILPYNASCVQVCMQWGREVREGGRDEERGRK